MAVFGGIVFIVVFFKCAFSGYEYITTTLIMMTVPLIYYGVRDRIGTCRFLQYAVTGALSSCLAVFVSVIILCSQVAIEEKWNALDGFDYIAYTLKRRTEGNEYFANRLDFRTSRLSRSTDARLKYTIYKTNADFLLISIGIFDNPRAVVTPSRPGRFEPSEEAYMGRGKTYYQFAYSYSQLLHGRKSAITDVLEKLSMGFDKYIQILTYMRGEYLDLVRRLTTGEVYHLERIVDEEKRNQEIRKKQDDLLDAYSRWLKSPSREVEEEIQKKAAEVKEMDPTFNFPWPPKPRAA